MFRLTPFSDMVQGLVSSLGNTPAKTEVSRVARGQESEEEVVVVGKGVDLGKQWAFALGAAFALDFPLPLVNPPPPCETFTGL